MKLEPCPFCGSPAEFGIVTHGGHFVQCTNTRCHGCMGLRFACGDDPKPALFADYPHGQTFAISRKQAERYVSAARERDALRDRWVMIDQLRRDEGCSVEIIHDNPDPGGSNCAIYVTDNFGQDYSTYYGDTIDDCLKQAVAARAALKGEQP